MRRRVFCSYVCFFESPRNRAETARTTRPRGRDRGAREASDGRRDAALDERVTVAGTCPASASRRTRERRSRRRRESSVGAGSSRTARSSSTTKSPRAATTTTTRRRRRRRRRRRTTSRGGTTRPRGFCWDACGAETTTISTTTTPWTTTTSCRGFRRGWTRGAIARESARPRDRGACSSRA